MKGAVILGGVLLWLLAGQLLAQQGLKAGLKGEYYNGTNFERKVMTRIDPQLNFTWKAKSPGAAVDQSYYSVRWTGKLLAPVSGKYTFNAKVDDGIRIWVGNKKVMDVWKLNDSGKFTGSIVLEAGQVYDLRVDYFNDLLGGVIELYWVRPDAEKPFLKFGDPIGELISARYFQQTAPPVSTPPKPVVAVPAVVSAPPAKPVPKRPAVVATVAKPVSSSSASVRQLKPIVLTPLATPTVSASSSVAKAAPEVAPASASAVAAPTDSKPATLRQVQFEQSSYVLLPQSFPELDNLVAAMRANPTWRIELRGHTDNVGDVRVNQTLSEYRTRMVMLYLTRRGIAEDRIETKGYGGSKPIAANDTEAGRAMNRRVEYVVK